MGHFWHKTVKVQLTAESVYNGKSLARRRRAKIPKATLPRPPLRVMPQGTTLLSISNDLNAEDGA